ncbi:GPH family glycoside/pentoside/hexuronide:cation symporter [Kushneria indalinina DSM 14324]|uniref:GPH family glycoside/pentoside/hexuronide:cation symporter n=1 Tax=Kushneria indalinina DSM 14324 TaxID=1122140 RepID=A0A3D9DZ04_9GAMM|nr:glycoside-pentoside-hexuronide (GPH):cation symporter [Kushneria indalinina]REC95998.1 GPH family glycoside/pentoside/hexuronide:cation symporter [Kushneria indalinina DSM 14324]
MTTNRNTLEGPQPEASSASASIPEAEKIGLLEKVGYGCGDLASNFIWQAMSIFIVYYYTDVIGIAAGVIGSIMLFSRVFDGVSDVAMGYIIDKTTSRHGKARPWLLWLAVPFAVSAVLLFAVPDIDPFWQVVYIAVTYNVVCLVYTGLNVPYGTMNSLITQDQYQRSLLNVFRMSLALVGVLLVSNLTLPVATLLGGGQFGWVMTFMMFGAIGTALFIFTFKTTRERVQPASQNMRDTKVSLKESLKTLGRNRYWVLATAFILLTYIFNGLNSGAVVYYAEYILDNTWLVGVVTTAYIAFILLGMVVVAPITKRFGKRNAIIVGEVITIFGYLIMLIDLTNVALIIAGTIIAASARHRSTAACSPCWAIPSNTVNGRPESVMRAWSTAAAAWASRSAAVSVQRLSAGYLPWAAMSAAATHRPIRPCCPSRRSLFIYRWPFAYSSLF